jgi:hypothetical protein
MSEAQSQETLILLKVGVVPVYVGETRARGLSQVREVEKKCLEGQ